MEIIDHLSLKRLCFTVTAGRTGTKLLTNLLRHSANLCAVHEPAPRTNFVLRSILECPGAAQEWLLTEKLPAIAASMGDHECYAELSHLTCKAFIEPLLDLGLRPRFVLITRPASAIASSLYKLNVIPERTGDGRLVLISPRHSEMLPFPEWENLSDYQLCYWYAKEIEARQRHYRRFFDAKSIEWVDLDFSQIGDWENFNRLVAFISGSSSNVERMAFDQILSANQNPREGLLNGAPERELPEESKQEESFVDQSISRCLIPEFGGTDIT